MNVFSRRRIALLLALALGASPALFAQATQDATLKTDFFKGKVVPLPTALEKHGIKVDPEQATNPMVLVTDDGKIYTLVRDEGCRMFFLDSAVRNRPMRLTAHLVPNSQFLQVIGVHSYVKGQLHEIFYWCDTCAIRDSEPGDCHCCGDKFELRETPAK